MIEGKEIYSSLELGETTLRVLRLAGVATLGVFATISVAAQSAGPIKPPPASPPAPKSASSAPEPGPTVKTPPRISNAGSGGELPPPTMPVDEIIQKFAAREAEFKEARGNYTYKQTVTVKEYDATGEAGGRYNMMSDIIFTPDGKRIEKVSFAPGNTLQWLQLMPEDMQDLQDIQPFVLTAEELPKYDIKYVAHERVDDLTTYVFDVTPKKVEKGKAYFKGRIWVDDGDLNIVKSYGQAIHGIKAKKGEETQLFPRFETIRENISGNYWFPTYTHADDILHFLGGDLRIVMTVKYENYKYFGSKIKIIPVKPQDLEDEELLEPPQF
jgi:hypothetical protein